MIPLLFYQRWRMILHKGSRFAITDDTTIFLNASVSNTKNILYKSVYFVKELLEIHLSSSSNMFLPLFLIYRGILTHVSLEPVWTKVVIFVADGVDLNKTNSL